MRTVLYITKNERDSAIKAAELAGEVMVHDDFNVGPGGENQLTFDTPKPDPAPTPEQILRSELKIKLADDSMTFEEMKQLARLERGL